MAETIGSFDDRFTGVAGSIPASGSTVGWWQNQQGERGVDPAGARARTV